MRPAGPTFAPLLRMRDKNVWVRAIVSFSVLIVTTIAVKVCKEIFPNADVGMDTGVMWGLLLMQLYIMDIPPIDAKAWKIVFVAVLLPITFVFAFYALFTVL